MKQNRLGRDGFSRKDARENWSTHGVRLTGWESKEREGVACMP